MPRSVRLGPRQITAGRDLREYYETPTLIASQAVVAALYGSLVRAGVAEAKTPSGGGPAQYRRGFRWVEAAQLYGWQTGRWRPSTSGHYWYRDSGDWAIVRVLEERGSLYARFVGVAGAVLLSQLKGEFGTECVPPEG